MTFNNKIWYAKERARKRVFDSNDSNDDEIGTDGNNVEPALLLRRKRQTNRIMGVILEGVIPNNQNRNTHTLNIVFIKFSKK